MTLELTAGTRISICKRTQNDYPRLTRWFGLKVKITLPDKFQEKTGGLKFRKYFSSRDYDLVQKS